MTGEFQSASVTCIKQKCSWKIGVLDPNALAYGVYNDTTEETGWGILNITAGHAGGFDHSDADIMFSAGFLEGLLTQK